MIFKRAWINKEGSLLIKIYFEDKKKDEWVYPTEAVYKYAQKAFREGDEIELVYVEEGGKKMVSRITKVKSKTLEPPKEEKVTEEKGGGGSYSGKSKFDSELSKRQTCMNATASVMQSLVGQVEINQVTSIMETIYKKALELMSL